MLKLFKPEEAKNMNSEQNQRDILRTTEIQKQLRKSQQELTNHEYQFNLRMASFKEQWANEEENHAKRLQEMTKEVKGLEERRSDALIPIDFLYKKAENILSKAEAKLSEANKKDWENDELKVLLEKRLDEIGEKEENLKEEKQKIDFLKKSALEEQNLAKINTANLTKGIEKFNQYVQEQNLLIQEDRNKIIMEYCSIEAQKATNERKMKALSIKERQLADQRKTLERAIARTKKMEEEKVIPEVTPEVTPETPVTETPTESVPESTETL